MNFSVLDNIYRKYIFNLLNKIENEPNNQILLHLLDELLSSFTKNQLHQIQNIKSIINNNPEYFKYFNEFKKVKVEYLAIINSKNYICINDNQIQDKLWFKPYRNLIQNNIEIFLNKKNELKEKLNKQQSKL